MTEIQIQPSIVYDVTTIGDAYVEMRSHSTSMLEAKTFERFIAGSAAQIALSCAMLGKKAAIIASVGADAMGTFVQTTFRNARVDVSGLQFSREHSTSLLFTARALRSLQTSYYRLADVNLHNTKEHVALAQSSGIIHASGFCLWRHPSRHSIFEILRLTKKYDRITVLNPFYEPALWRDRDEAFEVMKKTLQFADIATPTIDDAEHLFGKLPREEYVRRYHEMGAKEVVLLMGRDGCFYSKGEEMTRIPACPSRIIDPSGVTDAWHAGFYCALRSGKEKIQAAQFGNAVAAYALQQPGTLAVLPSADEIAQKFLKKNFDEI